MDDVLSAVQVSRMMVQKSHEIDQAITEVRKTGETWAQAKSNAELAYSQAFATAKGDTVGKREAIANIQCSDELDIERHALVLRESAKRALDARIAQLSALQSLASALREELKMARVDNFS